VSGVELLAAAERVARAGTVLARGAAGSHDEVAQAVTTYLNGEFIGAVEAVGVSLSGGKR
jgi:hypothetical protein